MRGAESEMDDAKLPDGLDPFLFPANISLDFFPLTVIVQKVNTPIDKSNSTTDSYIEAVSYVLYVTTVTQGILIFALNASLAFFFLKQLKLREKVSSVFFLNLQAVHIGFSISIILYVCVPLQSNIMIVLNNGLLMEMFFGLVLVSGDRYLTIMKPFIYERITQSKALWVIGVSWISPTIFIPMAIFLEISQVACITLSTVIIGIAAVTLIMLNIDIHFVAKKQAKAIAFNARKKRVYKATFVCTTIIMSFIVAWCPYFVHNLLVITNAYEPGEDKMFTRIVESIGFLNCCADPILYIVFHKDVKRELRRSFNRKGTLKEESIQIFG